MNTHSVHYVRGGGERAIDSAVASAVCFACAAASAGLGLGGWLHDGYADLARGMFFVLMVLGTVPLLRMAARETE
jgi:hypothetical protein